MKAKHFKKLRNRIGPLQVYKVRETFGLFGDFRGYRYGHKMDDHEISATSYLRAIKIYMRQYRMHNKKKCEYESSEYEETTEKWGHLMVRNESGYCKFF